MVQIKLSIAFVLAAAAIAPVAALPIRGEHHHLSLSEHPHRHHHHIDVPTPQDNSDSNTGNTRREYDVMYERETTEEEKESGAKDLPVHEHHQHGPKQPVKDEQKEKESDAKELPVHAHHPGPKQPVNLKEEGKEKEKAHQLEAKKPVKEGVAHHDLLKFGPYRGHGNTGLIKPRIGVVVNHNRPQSAGGPGPVVHHKPVHSSENVAREFDDMYERGGEEESSEKDLPVEAHHHEVKQPVKEEEKEEKEKAHHKGDEKVKKPVKEGVVHHDLLKFGPYRGHGNTGLIKPRIGVVVNHNRPQRSGGLGPVVHQHKLVQSRNVAREFDDMYERETSGEEESGAKALPHGHKPMHPSQGGVVHSDIFKPFNSVPFRPIRSRIGLVVNPNGPNRFGAPGHKFGGPGPVVHHHVQSENVAREYDDMFERDFDDEVYLD